MPDAAVYLESRSKLKPKQISGINKADPHNARRHAQALIDYDLMTFSTTPLERYEVKQDSWRYVPTFPGRVATLSGRSHASRNFRLSFHDCRYNVGPDSVKPINHGLTNTHVLLYNRAWRLRCIGIHEHQCRYCTTMAFGGALWYRKRRQSNEASPF